MEMKRSTKLQPSSTDKGAMRKTTVNSKDLLGVEGKQWRKRRKRWEKPPKIEIVFGDPIPEHNLEIIKEIIKKAILRKQTILKKENTTSQVQTPPPSKINKPQQHVIHKAILWKKLLENGTFKSKSDIAKKEGLTRARVTQIMNLLKLPPHWRYFLKQLDDSEKIRKYSERRLRGYDPDKYPCRLCPIKKKSNCEPINRSTD
jgi:hypothetical protein